jgi:hypothetical protein
MMRGFGLAAVVCAGWLSVAPALAVTLLLDSGETVEGAIIHATRNTVTIRPAVGGMRQIPVGRLKQVLARTAAGQALRGRYHGWVAGRAGIEVGSELLWLENGRVVARTPLAPPVLAQGAPPVPVGPASASAVTEPASESAETAPASASAAIEPTDASAVTGPANPYAATEAASALAVPQPTSEAAATEPASAYAAIEPTGASEPASESAETEPASAYAVIEPASAAEPASEAAETEPASAPAVAQAASAPAPARPADRAVASVIAPMPTGMPVPEPSAGAEGVALPPRELPAVRVTVAPDEVIERSGEIVFTLELSRPIDDLLVVIYSTVDGAARSGADYHAAQGILTLPAGATREQIRTAVIDDRAAEGDEEFQLFVATNPELTEVGQQWLRVTIHDDD